jgi:PAS domain S-box-containing protein
MTGESDPGFGKTAAAQTLRKRAEEKLAAGDKPFKDLSASEMSTLIHELRIHQVELEMQNEELRKSQAETERSRKAYQGFWELSPVGYLIVDFAGRVTAVNHAGQRLFGRPENALLKERFSMLVTRESQVPVHLVFERAVEKGIVEKQEIRILKPDGSIHICLLEVSSLGGVSGREQIQAVLTDITKQKRAEEVLRKSKDELELRLEQRTAELVEVNEKLRQEIEERKQAEQALCEGEEKYRQLFENESDAVMIFDAETGQFEDANRATLDLYDYSKDEILTLKVEDISAEKEKTRSNVKKFSDGGTNRERELLRYFNKKDGTVFPGEISTGELIIGGRKKIIGAVRDITERQRMQDDLRKSEEFSRSLLTSSPNPILVIVPDTSVKFVNPAFEKLTGYLSSEILGAKVPYPWWIEGLQSQTGKDFEKVLQAGILDLEQTFRKKNGEQFWVEISSKPVKKDGELRYYLSSWVDTTERRQAQEKLRASEEKYRTLVDNIAIGVALISPNMEILTINNQLQKWFPDIKLNKKPLCYQSFNNPPGEGVCPYCPTIQTLRDGQVHESLTETPAGDEIRSYRVISSPIKDAAGKVVAGIEMIEDVTERLRVQKALQESERRFKSIFENTPIGFYRTTPDGRILDANPALIQMLGYTCFKELAAVNLETHAYHPQYPRHQFRERIERDGVIKWMKSLWKKPDDTLVYMRENAIAVRDENGAVICYEGTIEDITDQKQAEEHIHLLSRQLMQAQEDERQMLSRELHDTVAQELSVAKMACDLIYNELLNGRIPEAQRIQTICETLRKTILGVRNMASDLRPPGLEELGLVETIYRFCEEFTQLWGVPVDFQAAGLKNLKPDYDIQINIYRLVQEGLTNIRKHADAGRVTLRLAAAFPNIILRIEDNGRGFDVQKRAAAAGQEKRMGLRSMQERVKLMNGEMKLQSKPGQGTKVSIKLPLGEKKNGAQENHLDR